jgi:hypothetical protein
MTTQSGKISTTKNLQRRSFRNKSLAGEDFSDCDIRGVDFTNASLTSTKFCRVQAGQTLSWLIVIISITAFLTLIAGYVSAYAAGVISSLLVMEREQPIALVSSVISLLVLAILMMIIVNLRFADF